MNIVKKNHALYGDVRFGYYNNGFKPFLSDVAKVLNIKDINKCVAKWNNDYLIEDFKAIKYKLLTIDGVRKLISTNSIDVSPLFLEWLDDTCKQLKSEDTVPYYNNKSEIQLMMEAMRNIALESAIHIEYPTFSVNYMYEPNPYYNCATSGNKMRCTKSYNTWKKNFPYQLLEPLKDKLDFHSPLALFIYIKCPKEFDTDNLQKPINDAIARYFNCSDHQIRVNTIECIGYVENNKDSEFYIHLENII